MLRLLGAILAAVVGLQAAVAQTRHITFDGEPYTRKFVGMPPGGDRLVEYVREAESFEKWTRLVGFRYQRLPGIDNDAVKFAQAMATFVKRANPQAQTKIIVDDRNGEAVLDFLTWPPDRAFLEFNVFRYSRSLDGKAVVSFQFAHRFTDSSSESMAQFRKLRQSWILQAASFDMAIAHREIAR